jgi:hypothetical protein
MELDRQFRVLDQMLSMHADLRDQLSRKALTTDVLLLGCSVIFCATTFASDSLLLRFGLSAQRTQFVLGIASIAAFFASLVSLRVDWKGRSVAHQHAVQKLKSALALFRNLRRGDGTWPEGHKAELHKSYWDTVNDIVPIPETLFVKLKARHLRKVAVSKMLDLHPGASAILLQWIVFFRSLKDMATKKGT